MKKVLSTFLLITLLFSAGTIYASSNSAQNLSDWYKKAFQKESEELGAATATGMISIFIGVNTSLKEAKKDIDTVIASIRGQRINDAKSGIERYQTKTINSLNTTVAELENVNFDEYVDGLHIEEEIDQDFEKMVEEVFGK
ncbi:hypothetical protein [Sporosarcina sp. JAI121]|uniref:hypothetical protein n=1 Tax=Sporosarcina sp. JAI121 TaxID=2723064 RepID=UPI0015CE0878|nr:hypothetical protein [Sporosarcina sp. JAI121]NYF23614.1 hypothetical protein [Sporosarcina sp. JAI121]